MAIEQDEVLEEQLFAAVRDHNSTLLGSLLGTLILTDADINARNQSGQTALEVAFDAECPDEMLLMLIDSGADVAAVVDRIAWAARSASPGLLKKFVDAGADVDAPGSDGYPLEVAARSGHLESVQLLIAAGAELDQGATATPLAEAVAGGRAACALALLAAGASLARANRSRPVLGLAAYKGMKDVAEALLNAGAQPNARISLREDHGVHDELSSVFDTMFGDAPGGPGALRYTDATPLIVAAGEGHADVVRLLVERGGDVRATDAHGMTAFDVAQQHGQTASVIALLDGGADPHQVPSFGWDLPRTASAELPPRPSLPAEPIADTAPTAPKGSGKTTRKTAKKKAKKQSKRKASGKKVAKKRPAKKAAKKKAAKKKATRKKAAKKRPAKKKAARAKARRAV